MRRVADLGVVLFLVLSALWLAVPSSVFIRHVDVEVSGTQVAVLRELPFGPVHIRYVETVRPIMKQGHAETPCMDAPRMPFHYPEPGGTSELGWVHWQIDAWAHDCMAGDFLWRAEWYVYLFGLIPLRPTTTELLVKS